MLAGFGDGRADEGVGAGVPDAARRSSWPGPRAGRRRTSRDGTAAAAPAGATRAEGRRRAVERRAPGHHAGRRLAGRRAEEAVHRRREGVVMATTLTPVLTDTWDADRSWSLATYEDAGGYRGLRRALGMQAADVVTHGQGLRPARPRGSGLPDGHEVGLPARARRRTALPGGQRRRVRAGDLQGHPADDGQPAAPDRGHDHHELRDRLPPRVPLRARRGAARVPPPAERRSRRRARPATSAPTSWAPASTSRSRCTPVRARTSAARRRRCSTRSRACAASRGSSPRSPRSPACTRGRPW